MTEYEYFNMNKGLNMTQRTLTDPSYSKRKEKVVVAHVRLHNAEPAVQSTCSCRFAPQDLVSVAQSKDESQSTGVRTFSPSIVSNSGFPLRW